MIISYCIRALQYTHPRFSPSTFFVVVEVIIGVGLGFVHVYTAPTYRDDTCMSLYSSINSRIDLLQQHHQ